MAFGTLDAVRWRLSKQEPDIVSARSPCHRRSQHHAVPVKIPHGQDDDERPVFEALVPTPFRLVALLVRVRNDKATLRDGKRHKRPYSSSALG